MERLTPKQVKTLADDLGLLVVSNEDTTNETQTIHDADNHPLNQAVSKPVRYATRKRRTYMRDLITRIDDPNLEEIVDKMNEFNELMMQGEQVSFEELDAVDGKFEDKVDAVVHVLDKEAAHIDWYKSEIKRLQNEVKIMTSSRDRLKNWLGYCIRKLGLKQCRTRFHRIFIKDSPPKATYDENDILLETIDPRCIDTYVTESRVVSKKRAIEIWKKSDEKQAPKGFTITRGISVTIK